MALLAEEIVEEWLNRQGFFTIRGIKQGTQEIDLLSVSDEHLLNSASQQGRVLFSFDADFTRLHAAGHQHAGIVYAPRQTAIGQQVRSLLLIYQILSPEEMINHLEFI